MLRLRERSLLHRGARFDFERLTLEDDDGREHQRDIVRHPGAVVVLPLLRDHRVVLIRNQRPAVGSTLWELPAGTLEAGESPEACAARELREETGYSAGAVRRLGRFYTTPGLTDEFMHAFLATELTPHEQRLDDGEQIEVHARPQAEVWSMIDSGELCDAKSALAIFLALRAGLLAGPTPEAAS